jgi:hypothetical protein
MRPLYLDSAEVKRVGLEGPALRVRSRRRADVFFPLARLARITVMGHVHWHPAALLACMHRDIPITFLSRDGGLEGFCFGAGAAQTPLGEQIQGVLARDDWQARFGDWAESEERRALLRLLRRWRVRAPDLRLKNLRPLARDAFGASLGTDARPIVKRLEGLLGGLVARILKAHGLPARFLAAGRGPFDLGAAFRRVLLWDVLARVSDFYSQRLHGQLPTSRRQWTGVFETLTPPIESQAHALLGRLSRWTREIELDRP